MPSPGAGHLRPKTPVPPIRVIGGSRAPFRDSYHAFLRMPWWGALAALVLAYLALNVLFAAGYVLCGGVSHARPRSLADAFFFSIQTMGTIGYGEMYPTTPMANALVAAESVTGLIVTALATGLVFAKFSQANTRVLFTTLVVISPMDGVPTLMFRLGNQRSNRILEAVIRLVMIRTEKTKEGVTFYRMLDLPLQRDRSPALARSWTALHTIHPSSPLYGQTPESLKATEVELVVTLVGVDDTSLQAVHARQTYEDRDIVWGARHVDILTEESDGSLTLDLQKFHDIEPTPPTPDFPYPRPEPQG